VAKAPADLRSLARSHTEFGLRVLCGIAQNSQSDSARVAAVALIWDRGWGKAPQAHTGENGEGSIRVTIRHILEHAAASTAQRIDQGDDAKVITLVPRKTDGDGQ
jgi:hypothetical protein